MIPSWLQAVLLGVLQGLTEFVPVSSSGHLVLFPSLLGWERPGLAFDVALHLGTGGAIVVYFRRELMAMARGILRGGDTPDGRLYRRLALLLAAASVPVALAGLLLHELFEEAFATPPAAAAFLFVTAAILVGGERWRARRVGRAATRTAGARDRGRGAGRHAGGEGAVADHDEAGAYSLPIGTDLEDTAGRTLDRVGLREALLIGAAQCVALFPGVSRSGTTIMAGVAAGLTRHAATRFSFLLALPALAGAGLLSIRDLTGPSLYSGAEILGGVLAAFVSSYLAIRFLVAFVSRQKLDVFAIYCVLAGAAGLGASLLGATA